MSWNPKNNSVDVSKIINNLFDFLEANQTGALAYFQPSPVLPDFRKFYRSASGRISTIFPCLMLIKKEALTDFSQDILTVKVRLLFEARLRGGNVDALVTNADIYAAAVESMLINCPPEVLVNDVQEIVDAINSEIESDFDILHGNNGGKSTAFEQVFQTRITYTLFGKSY